MKSTPRQQIADLKTKNGNDGWYGIHTASTISIENKLFDKAIKLSSKISCGMIRSSTLIYTIYNCLLDGVSIKKITEQFKIS